MTGLRESTVIYPEIHGVGDIPRLPSASRVPIDELDNLITDSFRETIENSQTDLIGEDEDKQPSKTNIPKHLRGPRKSSIIADNMKMVGLNHKVDGHDIGTGLTPLTIQNSSYGYSTFHSLVDISTLFSYWFNREKMSITWYQ